MRIGIITFSGTGTTALIAGLIREALAERGGNKVVCRSVEESRNDPAAAVGEFDALGFGYPVYDFRVPAPVDRFFDALPPAGKPTPVFLFAAYGLSMRDCHAYAVKKLADKGYVCVASTGFKTPPSVIALYAGTDRFPFGRMFRFERGLKEKAGRFAAEAAATAGAFLPGDPPAASRKAIMSALGPPMSRGTFGSFFYRNLAVSETCTGCGLCAKECPDGNLVVAEGRAVPEKRNGCVRCLRCVVNCPAGAINFTVRRRKGDVSPGDWASMLVQ